MDSASARETRCHLSSSMWLSRQRWQARLASSAHRQPATTCAGADQDLPELVLVGEPVQVAGAAAAGCRAGRGTGGRRPVSWSGMVAATIVEMVGVAAVLRRDARHQRRGERRHPLLDQGGRDGEQDAQRLGVQHVGEDQLGVLAGVRCRVAAGTRAGGGWAGVEAGADQRIGVAVVRPGCSMVGAAAGHAGVERADPGVLPGEAGRSPGGRRRATPRLKVPDDRVPGVVHAEGARSRAATTRLDVARDRRRRRSPARSTVRSRSSSSSAIRASSRRSCEVTRTGPQDLVQRAGVADLRVAAARAGAGVLGGEALADVAALAGRSATAPTPGGPGVPMSRPVTWCR